MKKKIGMLFILLLPLFTTSCGNFGEIVESSNSNETTTNPTNSTAPSSDLGEESKKNEPDDIVNIEQKNDLIPDKEIKFNEFFDINNVVNTEFDVSSSELQKLNEDYKLYSKNGLKSPIYRLANSVTFTINIDGSLVKYTYYNVGIRMKGNTSRHEFIDGNNNIYSPFHIKLSFEETFDDEAYYKPNEYNLAENVKELYKDRKFLGMSKLDLRYNKNQDGSYIREYYALEMFRDFGILAQHSNFTNICFNQDGKKEVNFGVYLMEEPLNKTFIKRSLSSGDEYINMANYDVEKKGKVGVKDSKYGQLYKASYGIGPVTGAPDMTRTDSKLFGVENYKSEVPPYELKTNTDTLDHTLIKKAFNVLNDTNSTYEDISNVVDLDYFYMFEAIQTVLGDPDDLRNNYNNYALYFRRTDGKMVIIPIDNDRVLGVSKDYDPRGNAMSRVGIFSRNTSSGEQRNNLYLKTILSNKEAQDKYVANIKKVLASKWVTNEYFNSIYNKVYTNYSKYTKNSLVNTSFNLNEIYDNTKSNMSFNDYITAKIKKINEDITKYENNESENDNPNNPIYEYENFYLTGTFDNWNKTTEKYKFKTNDGVNYILDIEINNDFECKIYCSDGNLWLMALNGEVIHTGPNMNITNVNTKVTFNLNKSTGILTYTIS